jgi:uncharacterized cupredoxin-like copper-binding protein
MRRFVSRQMVCVYSAALVAACAKAEPPAEQVTVAPVAPPVVHITASDYAFQAPDTLPSGVTTLHMMNQGKEIHHVVLVKMPLAELLKFNPAEPPPPDLVVLGGPNAAAPGGSAEATVDLQPGTYTLVCFVPGPDGKPHMMSGMTRALTVVQGSGTAAAPTPDIVVKLVDYDFQLSTPLTAGHHVIRIENAGPQPHELLLVRLEPGKTPEDFIKYDGKGPPPATPLNGASPMTIGVSNTVSVDITPGDYALICFIEDSKDRKPHFMHGMVKTIKVT